MSVCYLVTIEKESAIDAVQKLATRVYRTKLRPNLLIVDSEAGAEAIRAIEGVKTARKSETLRLVSAQ